MERPAALSACLLRRAHGDEGFSLIEALVALVILGIVGSGFSYGMTLTLQTTRDARLRQQATHLAEREIEIARNQFKHADEAGQASMLSSGTMINQNPLPSGTSGQDLKIDGRAFHVVRTHQIQLNGDGASPCDGGSSVDYLTVDVDVEVSWSDSGRTHTVQSQTLLTPVKGVEGDVGYVAAKLTGPDGSGTDHVSVTAAGPGGTLVRTTAADGCAVFMFASAGSYALSVNQSGYVNSEGFQSVSKTAALELGKLKVLPFSYAPAATLTLTYATDPGYTLPATLPRVTLFNSGLVGSKLLKPNAGNPTSISGLWPFPSGYSVWAGGCAQNDPASTGAARPASILAPGGATTSGTLYLAPLQARTMRLVGGVPVPAGGIQLEAVPGDTTGCDSTELSLSIGTTDAEGNLAFALPAGVWTISPVAPYYCNVWIEDANCPASTEPVLVTDTLGERPAAAPQLVPDVVVWP